MLSNRFDNGDKARVWVFEHSCANCNSNQGLALHHIYGCKGKYNNSICNSILLCNLCHLVADGQNIHQVGNYLRQKYLELTLKQIVKTDYQFTDNDKNFLSSIQEDVDIVLQK